MRPSYHMFNSIKLTLSIVISTVTISCMLTGVLRAEPIYHPSGPKLTFGGMTHRQLVVSDMGNPAHPAIDTTPDDDSGRYGVGLSLGLGIEYDGNDNLFDLLDQGGSDAALAPGDGTAPPDDGQDSTTNIKDLIGSINLTPEQEARLQVLAAEVADKVIYLGTFVATTMTGLNAKAFASADLPILISRDNDSAWSFGANVSITTNLRGLNDPVDLTAVNTDTIVQTLQDVSNQDPAGGPVAYTIGKSTITVDPASGDVSFYTSNNSGTITRAAQITEVGIGYSRKVWQQDDNKVYVGIKPKYYDVGLSNSFVFLSNIENAKSIFDALDKSTFKYTQGFGIDLGAIWTGRQYQLGATLTNINEPEFTFPEVDTSAINNQDIVNFINDSQTYVMERQLKLEAGYITQDGAWGINFGLDANAVPDPMRDDYQWLSFGAGFASDNWWLPGARIGVRHNLAGSELTYITGGITVFNIVNLDVATTTDTIKVDGDTYPRGLIVNIGAQVLF
ncbi:MAG: conjugal transfer protein TraF [Gammaproteobacteria bacterium]|nr:conjugal transfer protein TraF [Gammaproteobacteria bacterium]